MHFVRVLAYLTFSSVVALAAHISHSSYYTDEEALLAFKRSLRIDTYNSLQDWSPNHNVCNWTGVACSARRQRVVSLNLTSMALVGPISPFLGNLSFLSSLVLFNHLLEGEIPAELGRLFRLKLLRLSRNNLQGSIPSTLAACHSLQVLILSYNNLTSIPWQLGLLSNLEILRLGSNLLTGTIPPSLGNLSSLTNLELGNNSLFGAIPWEFGRLSKLQRLLLWDNQFSGEIPSSLSNCTLMVTLDIGPNQLSGTVPLGFGNLLQLQWLNVRENNLVSRSSNFSILTALINCSHLKHLDLAYNDLSGTLSSSVGRLSGVLSYLGLGQNKIEGNVPSEIGNLTGLTAFQLYGNRLNGSIPHTLCQLPGLEELYLGNNRLSGAIPECMGQARKLGLLDLSENMLSGKIPDSLGNLPQLRDLLLYQNFLSGKIPASLGKLQTLEMVDLSYNKLTGSIPLEVTGLQNVNFYFNISSNFLRGSLSAISKMVMVQAIDVSLNNFSGEIPATLSSCIGLEYLNLSWNSFDGPIPTSLSKLQNLEDMDLSNNNLSGAIPIAFQEMKMLQHINLSSNKLIGEVPKGGVFLKVNKSAVIGNLDLCGTWIGLPPCSYSKDKQLRVSKKVLVPLMIGIAIFIMSLLLVFYYWRKHRGQATLSLNVGPTRISFEELVDATSAFSQTNLLGVGSFGSVFKGVLKNGKNIAVKVLNLHDENANQSFNRECNVLKRVRHRNVIKIISACSNLDFKALVLPFMSNGSLERWLYPQGEEQCKLNLSDRLRLAIEIASGMAYLHHHCFVQVIHCDLKPSNVLLGDDMTPYLADFGIAKLLFGNSMDSLNSTSTLKGSTGYIAPEYGIGGRISTKGDVYSYGILLLELLTRRRPTDNIFAEGINIQKWIGMNFPNKILEVVDSDLLRDANDLEISMILPCLTQFIQVGLVCTRESPQQRPNMIEIVERLEIVRGMFLGVPRAFQLPIDISSLIERTSGRRNTYSGNTDNWSTSTS